MDKIVKDLNFEQIVIINNAICNCRDSIYDVISKYGIASNDIIKISNTFAKLINSVYDISDKDDYNDVMNLCHNFSQNVLEKYKQYYKQQLDEMQDKFNEQQ